jgi:hypothetical protein
LVGSEVAAPRAKFRHGPGSRRSPSSLHGGCCGVGFATATLLPDRTVLIAGGDNGLGVMLAPAEVYHPAASTREPWYAAAIGSMTTARDLRDSRRVRKDDRDRAKTQHDSKRAAH